MKTKINFLLVLTLLVILVGASAGAAAAQAVAITISPDTLLDGAYATRYSQQLSAEGGTAPYTFSVTSGSELPLGLILSPDGLLSGYPYVTPSSYPISITVTDYTGVTATRQFTLVIAKGMTNVVKLNTSPATWGRPFGAYVEVETADGFLATDGKVAFSVDGTVVPDCAAVIFDSLQGWLCPSMPSDLSVGSHIVKAAFTPNPASADLMNPAEAELTIEVAAGSYFLKGLIYNDANKNGTYDDTAGLAGWTVNLDEGCDAIIDLTATTESNGWFSFYNIPGAQCIRITEVLPPGWQQTTPALPDFMLSQDQNDLKIGNWYPTIRLSPTSLPTGTVGVAYSEQVSADGGTGPYKFTWSADAGSVLPPGLTLSQAGLISGTPALAGSYDSITIRAEDANGAVGNRYNLTIDISNPLIDGTFDLTSSSNPSPLGDAVTFTLSAMGNAVHPVLGTVPPVGYVAFTDNGNLIDGCQQQVLNINMAMETFGDYPATCTISALPAGPHTIQAVYTDISGLYNGATVTLEQQVGPTISISTETLQKAAYYTAYSQQLAASGGTEPYTFLLSGNLPIGFSLSANGLLSGFGNYSYGSLPGTYPITIQVQDAGGGTSSRAYNFVLDKGTPTLTPYASGIGIPGVPIYWNHPFTLWAEVVIGNYSVLGTADFSVDGKSVPECQAVSLNSGLAVCRDIVMNLSLGEHTFEVAYLPAEYEDYYAPAVVSGTFTVESGFYSISGFLFKDNDQDGVFDYGSDQWVFDSWTVILDQDCDGTSDVTYETASYGNYEFANLPGGHCYRITEVVMPGWQQTTQLVDFWLSSDINYGLNIGNYYPVITLSPFEPTLSIGSVGVTYNQAFTASGGSDPYTFTLFEGYLPDGLTFSPEGILSGTPNTAGTYYFTLRAEDASHAVGYQSYYLNIRTDGVFNFTSSSNPSAPDDLVTFTVNATGDVVDPYYGPLPPIGQVTFYDGGTAIAGCSDLYLNVQFDPDGHPIIGNYPAICETSALAQGTHQITATYYDVTGLYNSPELSLTQVVNLAASADLSITKTDSKDPVKPGARLIYTLVVSNLGPDTAENITLQDTLDRDTAYVSVSAPSGWTCKYASGKIICTSNSLASGSSATIQITVTVKKTAKVGKELINNAMISSVTYDPITTNNSIVQKTLVAK